MLGSVPDSRTDSKEAPAGMQGVAEEEEEEPEEGRKNTNWMNLCQWAGDAPGRRQKKNEGADGGEDSGAAEKRRKRIDPNECGKLMPRHKRHSLILAGCCFHRQLLAKRLRVIYEFTISDGRTDTDCAPIQGL